MGNERRATIYHNLWNQIKMGEYESSDISIAIDNKCFFSLPLESIYCDYLEGVYADVAKRVFEIDPTIKPRQVSFMTNFDDILFSYSSDNFSQKLETIFDRRLTELQKAI